MYVMSDKLTESKPRQQANRRIVEIQENKYGDMFHFESFCGNHLLRRSLYILERGLVSIGKMVYLTICACSSAHG